MDNKTYTYMKERVEKYERLNKRVKNLEMARKNTLFIHGLGVRSNAGVVEFFKEDIEVISQHIVNAIDLRIEKCKEEMEEI